MSIMLGKLYIALKGAGVADTEAAAAAEEVASFADRLARIEADLALLKWMAGANSFLLVVVLGILLRK